MNASSKNKQTTPAITPPAAAILVIDCLRSSTEFTVPLAFREFLGRSALQRNLYQLARHNVTRCTIALKNAQDFDVVVEIIEQQIRRIKITEMRCNVVTVDTLISTTEADWTSQVVLIDGNSVYDDRLFDAIFASTAPSQAVATSEGQSIGLFKVSGDDMRRVLRGGGEDLSLGVAGLYGLRVVDTDCVPRYVASMRRHLPPYWLRLKNADDLKAAADMVMDAAQKGVLDFPARYLHPLPENFLTRLAAATSITPNQITVLSAVVAFIATYLFAMESYSAALTLAIFAGILDGVDGKLARVKLLSSRFGDRLDHTLDVSFEFSWYLAIAWGLSRTHNDPSLLDLGFFVIGIMLAARALSGLYLYLTGHQIHDHTTFDRAVRLFAGRRNIYVLIMCAGHLLGDLLSSFYLVIVWGLATASIYSLRNAVAIMQKYARA